MYIAYMYMHVHVHVHVVRLTVACGEAEKINEGRSIVVGVEQKHVEGVGITGYEL